MALGSVVSIASGFVPGGSAVGSVLSAFKAPTPRTYGYLPGTLVELQEGVEGKVANLNGRTYTDVETVRLMDTERKSKPGMQSVWSELLPNWAPTPAALALIRQLDSGFQPRAGSGSSAGTAPALSAPAAAPDTTRVTPGGIIGTLPLWATVLLAGGLGYFAYKVVKKG